MSFFVLDVVGRGYIVRNGGSLRMAAVVGLPRRWSVADSAEIYNIRSWGGGYFGVSETGNIVCTPNGPSTPPIDMKELVDEVRRRGINLPLLIRFNDILKNRIVELNEAFRKAIGDYGYKGAYKGVYPIKVNQDRYVVETITRTGRAYNYG